jgi:hypothetical protein
MVPNTLIVLMESVFFIGCVFEERNVLDFGTGWHNMLTLLPFTITDLITTVFQTSGDMEYLLRCIGFMLGVARLLSVGCFGGKGDNFCFY